VLLGKLALPSSIEDSLIRKAAIFVGSDKIEGDYLEFGVFNGVSFIGAYQALEESFRLAGTPSAATTAEDRASARRLWERMRFFAFDSFQGLPEPTGIDAECEDFVGGKFACAETDFRTNLTRAGVPLDKVQTVPGWYEDTLNDATIERYRLEKAAIVNIDCDYYESARSVLEFVTPLLVDGSVIIFDDWYKYRGHPDFGEQRACREWIESHPEWMLTEYQKGGVWKNSFVANRRG
jgi:hypothetical protein